MTIADLKINEVGTIKNFNLEVDYKNHIQEIGFHIGSKIFIINKSKYGSIVLIDDKTRIFLDKEVAENIIVSS